MVVRSSYGYEEFWLLNRWEASPPVRQSVLQKWEAIMQVMYWW